MRNRQSQQYRKNGFPAGKPFLLRSPFPLCLRTSACQSRTAVAWDVLPKVAGNFGHVRISLRPAYAGGWRSLPPEPADKSSRRGSGPRRPDRLPGSGGGRGGKRKKWDISSNPWFSEDMYSRPGTQDQDCLRRFQPPAHSRAAEQAAPARSSLPERAAAVQQPAAAEHPPVQVRSPAGPALYPVAKKAVPEPSVRHSPCRRCRPEPPIGRAEAPVLPARRSPSRGIALPLPVVPLPAVRCFTPAAGPDRFSAVPDSSARSAAAGPRRPARSAARKAGSPAKEHRSLGIPSRTIRRARHP